MLTRCRLHLIDTQQMLPIMVLFCICFSSYCLFVRVTVVGEPKGVESGKKAIKKAALVSSSVAKPCIGFQCDFNALLLRAMLLKRREE